MFKLACAGLLAGILLVARWSPACPPIEDRFGPAVPDFVEARSGGYAGLVAGGGGYSVLTDTVNLFGLYGFVPAAVGGTDIQSVLIAVSVRVPGVCPVRKMRWVPFYLGAGGLFAWGDGFFIRLPERYPTGYYLPTGVRGIAFAGTELSFNRARNVVAHGPFWEVVTVDVLFLAWLENQRTISFWDVTASAVGYRFRF